MAQKTDRGFISNNPGIVASVVAIVIGVSFLAILVNEGKHPHHSGGAQHGGAAPAASAPAAHH